MVGAMARAALASHCGYRHTPSQLLQRVSDTLWQTSTGEQLTSLLYARVDPETGDGEIASAGSISAIIASRYGYRPVADGLSEPLNTHLNAQVETETFRIQPGETLLAYTAGLIDDGATQSGLGEQLRIAMARMDLNPLAEVRRAMATTPLKHERGAVTLLWQ
jgi:sigma-B regulation protein RsbU (phosphoserine phosphatase)